MRDKLLFGQHWLGAWRIKGGTERGREGFYEPAFLFIKSFPPPPPVIFNDKHNITHPNSFLIYCLSSPPTQELLSLASLVCPNETELALLTHLPVDTLPQIQAAAHKLREMGAATVLVTLGAQGALLLTAENDAKEGGMMIPCPKVAKVVDTSGAGDCFLGCLAAYISRGVRLQMGA